ncbi:MAG: hypothetical protein H0T73_13130 [Ardenticatenales bacterium]|nr:hypothetical protein [Ardenticatenales bacterium]
MHDATARLAQEVEAMSQQLQEYLLDERLFKTISVQTPQGDWLIKMTLGGMLERLNTLETQSVAPEIVHQARETLSQSKSMMAEQYYQKLGREAKSYTDSWNWFLQNCWEGEGRCRADYPQEVAIRLRLEQLLQEGESHAALADSRQRLQTLDERLRTIWEDGEAISPGGTEHYPKGQYWWLYGRPQPQSDS